MHQDKNIGDAEPEEVEMLSQPLYNHDTHKANKEEAHYSNPQAGKEEHACLVHHHDTTSS